MIGTGAADPFLVLGVPVAMDLDEGDLERRYLALSRECHPDYHRGAGGDEQTAVLQRAAQLNDAYRILVDSWRRAEAILELSEPGVLERTKQLCPAFLMEALDVAEEVAVAPAATVAALQARLRGIVDRYLGDVARHLAERQWTKAATHLHESRYYRKALADLQARA